MMMKTLFLALLLQPISSADAHLHTTESASADTLNISGTVNTERWEYKTLYIHNTHINARQGEVVFKAHADSETLNRHGREGWELVAITPVIPSPWATTAPPRRCLSIPSSVV